jgi:hypothetical protein
MGFFSFIKYTFIIFAAHRLRITDIQVYPYSREYSTCTETTDDTKKRQIHLISFGGDKGLTNR